MEAKRRRRSSKALQGPPHEPRLTGSLRDGDFVVLTAGSTGEVVREVTSADEGRRARGVAIFTLGQPKQDVVDRLLCTAAEVELPALRAGTISPDDWVRLTQAAARLSSRSIWVDDRADLDEIRSAVARLQSEFNSATQHLAVVVVDGWRRVRGRRRATQTLREVARELVLSVVATV